MGTILQTPFPALASTPSPHLYYVVYPEIVTAVRLTVGLLGVYDYTDNNAALFEARVF